MARILLAWELGGAYGHVMRFATLARELARRGHEPVFALKDLAHVETALGSAPYTVLQAPVWLGEVSGLPPPLGFAETTLRLGFLHPKALHGICRAWRALLAAVQPALIVCDYAPTALLASRGLGIPRIVFGESFSSPPRSQPLPPYASWRVESRLRMAESESHALAGANAALDRLGQPPLARLADLLDTEEEMFTCWPEFDQYPGRSAGVHLGPLANLDDGVAPHWPEVDGPRVFAYLKAQSRDFDAVINALRALEVSAIVHAPGLSQRQQRLHLAPNIRFQAEPVRMADVCREAALGICNSGASTTQVLVGAGMPVLLLPEHIEQMTTAKRAAELGAGLVVDYEKAAPDFKRLLRRLLGEAAFREAAQAFAARHAGDDQAARLARICDRIEALLPAPAAA